MPPPTIRCPECNSSFDLSPDNADRRRLTCPDCGARFANPTWNDPDDDRDGRRSDDPDDRRRRRRRPPVKPSSAGKVILFLFLGGGVLLLGCCGGLGWLGWSFIKPTSFPEPAEDYADARKSFRTTLIRQQPAPQQWPPVMLPQGVREISYQSGGLKLRAWIDEIPQGRPPRPAVLFLHGGFAFGDDDWDQCEPFRRAGFVTMTPMLRGENGLPGSYSMFYDEVDDVLAAAEVLARTPGVDPNRLYVAGHSAGGTLAMLAAMTSRRFKAAASFSGSPDQVAWSRGQGELVPFDQSNKREFAMRSPLAYYQSFKCPTRLYYGSEEFLFEFSTQKLTEKATAAGLNVQAVEVPGDHGTMVEPAMRQAVAFFQQTR
jgi:dienelactone hydrolase